MPFIGNATSGVSLQQRCDRGGDLRQGRGLHRHDHRVLRSEVARIVACRQVGSNFLIGGFDVQAANPDRRKVGTARHHRHLGASLRQEARQVTADRAGTEDADAHGSGSLPPPLLRGRAGERGACGNMGAVVRTPLPNPPLQGGREQASVAHPGHASNSSAARDSACTP